jgi:soluble lytic murein transglycosylase-like protein
MNKSDPRAAIWTHAARTSSSFFPAIPSTAVRGPQACHVARRRQLLRAGIACALLIASGVTGAAPATEMLSSAIQTSDPFAAFVSEASQLFGIPASWIRAVMRLESAGDVRSVSPKGAMGLMQIMPETWAGLRARYGLGADPFDAHDNILAGAAYLRELHDRYGEPGFLAAYNAGPARYEQHLASGQPLPSETQNYVATLTPIVAGEHIDGAVVARSITQPWTEAELFVARSGSSRTTMALSSATHDRQQPARTSVADWTALAPQSAGLFVATDHRTAHS